MTYNASHSLYMERALRRLEPGDFFLISNGMTWDNFTTENPVNALIRGVSNIPFGHAALYVGNGKVIDLPLQYWSVRDMFSRYKSNGAAFVHCKTLTREQRGRIKTFAKVFYEDYKSNPGMSYGSLAMSTGAAGELGTTAARTLLGDFFGKTYDKFFQAPATAASITSAAVHAFFGKQPALSCSAFITYAHAVAGHAMQDRFWRDLLAYPTHCTPGQLWDIVRVDKKKYDIDILDFSKDRNDLSGTQSDWWDKEEENAVP